MIPTFSALDRPQHLQHLQNNTFDLLVIGGGITGAGIALDAASRGLTTALIEMRDFGWGTSSRSTKLIHGGLRYLKQFEINLVREVGRERAILHNNAPHIVIPENMLLPIYQGGSLGKFSTSVGLYVYDWLAGVKREERRKMLSREQTLEHEPLLEKEGLQGAGLYKEYRTDDARLVAEVLKTAVSHGALCLNYIKADELTYDNGQVTGAKVTDQLGEQSFNINAKKVVNAAGPWVDELRKKDRSLNNRRMHLTKGVHLVVPYDRLPVQQSAYFDVGDGRMIFVIARDEVTYIGTTDTNYKGETGQPKTTRHDVLYLLKAVNRVFPSVKLTGEDVTSTWAGVRPLIHEEGKGPSELSRKDEIFVSDSGLITIAGGKLTGFRKMAERTVDKVVEGAQQQVKPCQTEHITLSGGDFGSETMEDFVQRTTGEARQVKIKFAQVQQLVNRYGTNTAAIIEKAYDLYHDISDPEERRLAAELHYTVEQEMVHLPADFFIRRTGQLYFHRPEIADQRPVVNRYLTSIFSRSTEQQQGFDTAFEQAYQAVLDF